MNLEKNRLQELGLKSKKIRRSLRGRKLENLFEKKRGPTS